MLRPLLVAIVLFAASGCSEARLSPHEASRAAATADDLGQRREAMALYRDAARRGDVDAQLALGRKDRARHSLGDWLFEALPSPAEAARWTATARRDASARAAAGDPDGYLTLANITMFSAQDLGTAPAAADSFATARRHIDAAIALGSREAILRRPYLVWQSDGMLAAETYFREAVRAGYPDQLVMVNMIVLNRPALALGEDVRDGTGDLSLRDLAGSIRLRRDSGIPMFSEGAVYEIDALRAQARAGDAVADSLLRALAARDARA